MNANSLKENLSTWWAKEFGGGFFSVLFSLLMKITIPVFFIVWIIKKLIVCVLLFPVLIISFLLWEGRTRDSFIHLAILVFPAIKILYLADDLKEQGYVTTKKANVLFIFVTIVFLELFFIFSGRIINVMDKSTGSNTYILPIVLAGIVFIIFEVAIIFGFNLVARGYFDEKKSVEKKERDWSEKKANYFAEESEETFEDSCAKETIDCFHYRRNIAGHLPMTSEDDII